MPFRGEVSHQAQTLVDLFQLMDNSDPVLLSPERVWSWFTLPGWIVAVWAPLVIPFSFSAIGPPAVGGSYAMVVMHGGVKRRDGRGCTKSKQGDWVVERRDVVVLDVVTAVQGGSASRSLSHRLFASLLGFEWVQLVSPSCDVQFTCGQRGKAFHKLIPT